MMRSKLPGLALLLALLTASACAKKTPPGPLPQDMLDPNAGYLTVLRTPVDVHEREQAPGQALGKGDGVDLPPGGNVIVGETGHAALAWADFLDLDLAPEADLLLSQVEVGARRALMDQALGTVRYRLGGEASEADLTIQVASWVKLHVEHSPADVIVSLMAGTEPAAWVAVVKGTVNLSRGADELRLKGGQVAAFSAEGPLPQLLEIDREALSDWYDDMAGGAAEALDPARYLFRCRVDRLPPGAEIWEEPGVGQPLRSLDAGTVVQVSGTSIDRAWVFANVDDALSGWLAAAELTCNAPMASLGVDLGTPEPTATAAASATPAATVAPSPRATLARPTATTAASPPPSATLPIATATASATVAAPSPSATVRTATPKPTRPPTEIPATIGPEASATPISLPTDPPATDTSPPPTDPQPTPEPSAEPNATTAVGGA